MGSLISGIQNKIPSDLLYSTILILPHPALLNYVNAKLLQSRLKELGDIESRSKNKQITMSKAQFQQMKSTGGCAYQTTA